MLYDAVYGQLIDVRSWPQLDQILAALWAGDATPALEASGETSTDPPITIENAAPLCLDLVDRRGARAIMAEARRAERRAPVFARPTIAGLNVVCSHWPVAAGGRPHPVTAAGSAPILVVGITHDTAGPYRWAQSLAGQLENGRLLTLDGYGHGALLTSSCIKGYEIDFLSTGALPPSGTTCRM